MTLQLLRLDDPPILDFDDDSSLFEENEYGDNEDSGDYDESLYYYEYERDGLPEIDEEYDYEYENEYEEDSFFTKNPTVHPSQRSYLATSSYLPTTPYPSKPFTFPL